MRGFCMALSVILCDGMAFSSQNFRLKYLSMLRSKRLPDGMCVRGGATVKWRGTFPEITWLKSSHGVQDTIMGRKGIEVLVSERLLRICVDEFCPSISAEYVDGDAKARLNGNSVFVEHATRTSGTPRSERYAIWAGALSLKWRELSSPESSIFWPEPTSEPIPRARMHEPRVSHRDAVHPGASDERETRLL